MITRRGFLGAGLAAVATLGRPGRARAAALTFGPASFDVTPTSALIWLRADGPARVHVEYGTRSDLRDAVATAPADIGAGSDFTSVTTLRALTPGTEYFYRGVVADGGAKVKGPTGRFRTAPIQAGELTFAWGGDMNATHQPFATLEQVSARRPDFFLMLGDTMYADVPKHAFSPTLAHYRAKHGENRADPALQALLATTSVAAMWDDHEVENNFDRTHPGLAAGRQAFREYWPVRTSGRLYRRFTWTPAVEVFMLDCRSYRSQNGEADGPRKTMLGAEQKAWLGAVLKASTATFKLIASSVPCLPDMRGDAWSGFKTERAELLEFIARERLRNVVILSADFHMALDLEADGVQEFLAGPLGAVLPCRGSKADARKQALASLGRPFFCDTYNFGVVTVRPDLPRPELDVQIIDAKGLVRLRKTIRSAGS